MKIIFLLNLYIVLSACTTSMKFPEGASLGKHKPIEAKYCPDNTCETLNFKSSVNEDSAKKAFWTYLYGRSDYIYLEEWRKNNIPDVGFLFKDCQETIPLNQIRTDKSEINKLHDSCYKDSYTVKFQRFDEGELN